MKTMTVTKQTKQTAGKSLVCVSMALSIFYSSTGSIVAKEAALPITPTSSLQQVAPYKAREELHKAVQEVMKQPVKQVKEVKQQTAVDPNSNEAAVQDSATPPVAETPPVREHQPQTQAAVNQPQAPAKEPVQQPVSNPVALKALSLVGSAMWCEEVAQASIQTVGKSAWLTRTYEEGDILVEESSMGPSNFLQIAYQVSLNALQPGDLLYYANNGSGIAHIAVYVGNGQVVHGGYGGRNVVIAGIYLPNASTPIGLRL